MIIITVVIKIIIMIIGTIMISTSNTNRQQLLLVKALVSSSSAATFLHTTSSKKTRMFSNTKWASSSSSSSTRIRTKRIMIQQQQPILLQKKTTTTRLFATTTTTTTTIDEAIITTTKKNHNKNNKKKNYLVIVESPAKCKTIENILNSNNSNNNNNIQYTVKACMGHIRNLPSSKQQEKEINGIKTNKKTIANNNNKKKKIDDDDDTTIMITDTTTTKNTTSDTILFPYKIAGIELDNYERRYQPTYTIIPGKEKIIHELKNHVQNSDTILLATDPDREGEAMAWHIIQTIINDINKPYRRLRFTEITEQAIIDALNENNNNNNNSNDINNNLVISQETRRVLDRLAGYTVSPILWKKITPGLSAGRVQSVGLYLIVQREKQRLLFESTTYYNAIVDLLVLDNNNNNNNIDTTTTSTIPIQAKLNSINGTIVANTGKDFQSQGQCLTEASKHKLHLRSEHDIQYYINKMIQQQSSIWKVISITSKQRTMQSPKPYKTSTLQQDSVKTLGISVTNTMKTAQQLYESGYISYMRTDSINLSNTAEQSIQQSIIKQYGDYMYNNNNNKTTSKKDTKHTQEAHEAIRPAIQNDGTFAKPETLPISGIQLQLYTLIYQRTIACRMQPLITNQTQVVIQGDNGQGTIMEFRTSGSIIVKPGYTLAYNSNNNDNDDDDDDDSKATLPPLHVGQELQFKDLVPTQHTTQPPPRYTEASFVKELESLGVGRPSTYAKIVQILRDRAYVGSPNINSEKSSSSYTRNSSKKTPTGSAISAFRAAGGNEFTGSGNSAARGPLVPSLSAFVVCDLLEKYCTTYIDPKFTSNMENRLDIIANNNNTSISEKERIIYLDEFYAGKNGLASKIQNIDNTVDATIARRAILPALSNNANDDDDDIGLYIGPWGPYIQKKIKNNNGGDDDDDDNNKSVITVPLPPAMAADISTIRPSTLKALLSLKESGGVVLGQHPDDGRNIRLKTGRFGAYLQWGDDSVDGTTTHTLPKHKASMKQIVNNDITSTLDNNNNDNTADIGAALGITLDEAIGYVGLPRTICTLNDLPITAAIGPYGPYLKYNNTYTSLNLNDGDVLTIDAETAQTIVTERIINGTSKLGRGVLAEIGEKDGSKVTVKSGRFGSYLNWKRINAKLPNEYIDNPSDIPLDEAWSLIQEKAEKTPNKEQKKKTTTKNSNLPPPPKRPLSAYLHFCADKRPEVTKTVKSLGEVSKKLASMWADTSDTDRIVYEEMAAKGKEEYEIKKKEWEEECKKLSSSSTSSSKKEQKTSNLPKRPKSAYLYFCAAHRPKVAKHVQSLGDISKELARLWAETSDRNKYEELATADKIRYENEMQKLKKNNSVVRNKSGGSSNKIRIKTTTKSSTSTSTPRAPSAYMLFCKEYRSQMVDDDGNKLPFGETTKKLATMWKACDNETREKFHNLANKEKENLLSTLSK